MSRRTFASVAAVLVLGSLTACGDEGGDSGSSASAPASSSAPASGGPTVPPGPSVNADAAPTGADKVYCDAVVKAQRDLADTTAASDNSVKRVASALDEITRLAPSDVRQQWQLVADTVQQVRAAARKAGIDVADLYDVNVLEKLTPEQKQALTEGLSAIDSTGLPQANQDIATQVAQVCGVALSSAGPVSTP